MKERAPWARRAVGEVVSAGASPSTRHFAAALAAAAALLVAYAGLCKALLFRDLEYVGSDMYSFLDMGRSWFSSGRVLWDNVYGDHTAIHNFYLLLAFSPLTIPFGAYGLVAALVLLNIAAALRVAYCPALDAVGRVATAAALLGPAAFFVLDHPDWGFHRIRSTDPVADVKLARLYSFAAWNERAERYGRSEWRGCRTAG